MYIRNMKYDEFEKELIKSGLNLKDFSTLTNIPLSTIYGWSSKRKFETPSWTKAYLDLYKKSIKQNTIIKYLEEKLDEKS